jgi:hypothetical protein
MNASNIAENNVEDLFSMHHSFSEAQKQFKRPGVEAIATPPNYKSY